jgi:hypothetical protein
MNELHKPECTYLILKIVTPLAHMHTSNTPFHLDINTVPSESKLTVFSIPSHTLAVCSQLKCWPRSTGDSTIPVQQPMVLVTDWEMSQFRSSVSTPATSEWMDLKDNVGSMKYNQHHHYSYYS